MKEMNTMYLRRRNKMIVSFNDEDSEKVSEQIIATSLVNLESYGYTFSEKLIEELRLLSPSVQHINNKSRIIFNGNCLF